MNDTQQNVQYVKKDNDSKKIFTMLVLIFTLMICTTGATYAFFAITASANNAVSGEAASVNGKLFIAATTTATSAGTIAYLAPATDTYKSKPMVPQISYRTSNVLQKAFTGTSGVDKCVDGNGNVICKAYTFAIKNTSNAALDVRGYINFTSSGTFNNLRWKLMTSASSVAISSTQTSTTFSATMGIKANPTSTFNSNNKIYFDTSNVALAANGGSKQYYLIVWIEETGSDQNTTDTGTWYATIGFDVFNETGSAIGGLTSTITS